ncbi:hypothetical protein FGIG_09945 [Fasciola gigantica]|uniref:Uncharacterized protein n=1 Tax=Fasciola gigantica TaxID=46835 RepID=A0A504WV87_FASGI|nr:hypothetical protein FGIG_09945 [Fasciola gigantica]
MGAFIRLSNCLSELRGVPRSLLKLLVGALMDVRYKTFANRTNQDIRFDQLLRTKPLSSRPSSNSFVSPYVTKSLSPLGSRKRVNVVSFIPGTDGQELITKSPEKPPSDSSKSNTSFDPFSPDSTFLPGTSLSCDNPAATGIPVLPKRDMALNPSFKRMHVSSAMAMQSERPQIKPPSSVTDNTNCTVGFHTREIGSIIRRPQAPGVRHVLTDGTISAAFANASTRSAIKPAYGAVNMRSIDRLTSATKVSPCNAASPVNLQLTQGNVVTSAKPLGLSRTTSFPFPTVNSAHTEDRLDNKKPVRTLLCGKNKRSHFEFKVNPAILHRPPNTY